MKFDNDIFISYAHNDNLHLDNEKGLIDHFQEVLLLHLTRRFGRKPNIWRDLAEIRGNTIIDDSIFESLAKVAVFIPVFSPSFMKSKWCPRELATFYKYAEEGIGVKISENKTRIFKISTLPISIDDLPQDCPESLRSLLKEGLIGYEFYEVNKVKNRYIELNINAYGSESYNKFTDKVADLAQDISETLSLIEEYKVSEERVTSQFSEKEGSNQGCIYLAETTEDLDDDRKNILRDLKLSGYKILPDKPFPSNKDFEKEIPKILSKCILSVHLLHPKSFSAESSISSVEDNINAGEETMDEINHSLLVRSRSQIEFAIDYFSENSLGSCIVWVPSVKNLTKKELFFNEIKDKVDFLEMTPIENLKTLLKERIKELTCNRSAKNLENINTRSKLYFDFDDRDRKYSDFNELFDYLEEVVLVQFEAFLSTSSGYVSGSANFQNEFSSDKRLTQSEAKLSECKAALIYYREANSEWLRSKISMLLKTIYLRTKSPSSIAVYVPPPPEDLPEIKLLNRRFILREIEDLGVHIIEASGSFDKSLIENFVKSIGEDHI